jgi:predicted transcriptional regulator
MKEFGDLEARIMDALWSAPGALTVREIREQLGDRRSAYTTVMTVTQRLHVKGWISCTAHGRAYLYAPLHPRSHYTAQLLEQALASTTDRTAALVQFAGELSPAEATAMAAALDLAKGKAETRRGRKRRSD